jgi:hypothetical protein
MKIFNHLLKSDYDQYKNFLFRMILKKAALRNMKYHGSPILEFGTRTIAKELLSRLEKKND